MGKTSNQEQTGKDPLVSWAHKQYKNKSYDEVFGAVYKDEDTYKNVLRKFYDQSPYKGKTSFEDFQQGYSNKFGVGTILGKDTVPEATINTEGDNVSIEGKVKNVDKTSPYEWSAHEDPLRYEVGGAIVDPAKLQEQDPVVRLKRRAGENMNDPVNAVKRGLEDLQTDMQEAPNFYNGDYMKLWSSEKDYLADKFLKDEYKPLHAAYQKIAQEEKEYGRLREDYFQNGTTTAEEVRGMEWSLANEKKAFKKMSAEVFSSYDEKIADIQAKLRRGYETVKNPDGDFGGLTGPPTVNVPYSKEAIAEMQSEIQQLQRMRESFFKPFDEQLIDAYTENKDDIEAMAGMEESLFPKNLNAEEALRVYYMTLAKEYDDISEHVIAKMDDLEKAGSSSLWGAFGSPKWLRRHIQLKNKLENLAPIVFFNQSPLPVTGENALRVFGASALETMSGLQGYFNKQTVQAGDILESINLTGGKSAVLQDHFDLVDRKTSYDTWSLNSWMEGLGSTAGFMIPFLAGSGAANLALRGTKAWQALSLLSSTGKLPQVTTHIAQVINKSPTPLNRLIFGGLKAGAEYEITGQIFSQVEDEANFLSGLFGGVGGEATEMIWGKGLGKMFGALFKDKAPAVANKIANYMGRGFGETAEEFSQEFAQIYKESETLGEAVSGFMERFSDPSETLEFAVQTYIMGMAFGVSGDFGRANMRANRRAVDGMPLEEQKDYYQVKQEIDAEIGSVISQAAEQLVQFDKEGDQVQVVEEEGDAAEPEVTTEEEVPVEPVEEELTEPVEEVPEVVEPVEEVPEVVEPVEETPVEEPITEEGTAPVEEPEIQEPEEAAEPGPAIVEEVPEEEEAEEPAEPAATPVGFNEANLEEGANPGQRLEAIARDNNYDRFSDYVDELSTSDKNKQALQGLLQQVAEPDAIDEIARMPEGTDRKDRAKELLFDRLRNRGVQPIGEAEDNYIRAISDRIGDNLTKTNLKQIGEEHGLADPILQKEMAEYAILQAGRSIVDEAADTRSAYDQLIQLYENQPNLTARSSESVRKQQYSTPIPISYMAGNYVGLADKTKQFYEPSAGTGLLTIAGTPSNIRVNEIDQTRLRILRAQPFLGVTNRDGAAFHPDLEKQFDGVVTNPPFDKAPVTKIEGYNLRKLEHIMAARALQTMKDSGRAAIIIGGHNEFKPDGFLKKDRVFFNYLLNNYNVEDIVNISGDLYKKQGTKFPIRLILINGRKTPSETPITLTEDKARDAVVEGWDSFYERLQNKSYGTDIVQPGTDADREGDRDVVSPVEPEATPGEVPVRDEADRTDDQDDRGSQEPRGEPGPPDRGPAEVPAEGDGGGATGDRTTGERPVSYRGKQSDVGMGGTAKETDAEPTGRPEPGVVTKSDLQRDAGTSTDKVIKNKTGVTKYTPRSKNYSVDTVTPVNMYYPLQRSLRMLEEKHGNIDEFVANKLRYDNTQDLYNAMSAEQIDAVALSIEQIESNNQAVIIGDQTGIGKGRVAAAMIRYGVIQGKKPVFITESSNLFTDIYRDLVAIGSGDLKPFIINTRTDKSTDVFDQEGKLVHKSMSAAQQLDILVEGFPEELKTAKQKQQYLKDRLRKQNDNAETAYLPLVSPAVYNFKNNPEFNFAMVTYSQAATPKGKLTLKTAFLQELAKDNIAVLDESHNAAGSSATNNYFKEVVKSLRGGIFLSATYGKRPDNMPLYAMKTAMKDANVGPAELIANIENGGAALQEILSADLVEAGQLVRRERAFDGVRVDYDVLEKYSKQHEAVSDRVTEIIRDIIKFEEKHIKPLIGAKSKQLSAQGAAVRKRGGTSQMGINNVMFASKVHNVIDQLLFSIKAEAVADRAVELLKEDKKPVIALKNTMGTFLKDLQISEDGVLVADDLDFSISLIKGLEGTMKYSESDHQGNVTRQEYTLADLSKEGVSDYRAIEAKINKASSGITISPIDVLIYHIEKAGYRVGEVTGRKHRLSFQDNGSATMIKRDVTDKNTIFRGFNSRKKKDGTLNPNGYDVLIINQSGATGASAHASKDFEDQRERTMIIHQMELDVNKEVQKRGRTNRTGQVVKPSYEYKVSSIPAETRLLMVLKTKLKSLEANTTSSQKGAKKTLVTEDFINKYGDQVVYDYLRDNPVMNKELGDPLGVVEESIEEMDKEATKKDLSGAALKVTGYVARLKVKDQRKFYDDVIARYQELIDYLNQTGTNDLEVKEVDLKAKTLSKKVVVLGKKPDSPFGHDSYLEEAEVNVLKKPFTKKEIDELMEKALAGATPQDYIAAKVDAYNEYFETYYEKQIEALPQVPEQTKIDELQAAYDKETDEERKKELQQEIVDLENQVKNIASRRAALEAKLKGGNFYVTKVLQSFPPGRQIEFVLGEGEDTFRIYGVALGVDIKERGANHYAPSNININIALANSMRQIKVPASKRELVKDMMASQTSFQYNNVDLLKDWEKYASQKSRENRYIVTGNILQAYGKHRGQLITYTTDDGDLKKGILLNQGYSPKDTSLRLSIARALPILHKMEPREMIYTSVPNITIQKSSGLWELRVPASKAAGGQYFLDQKLSDLSSSGRFDKIGQSMVADYHSTNLQGLIDHLSDKYGMTIDLTPDQAERFGYNQVEPGKGDAPNAFTQSSDTLTYEDITPLGAKKKKTTARIALDPIIGVSHQELKGLNDIILDVSKKAKVKVSFRRPQRRTAAGDYNPSNANIRLRLSTDLSTTAHEIGHFLDDTYQLMSSVPTAIEPTVRKELLPFSVHGSKPPKGYPNKDMYIMAEGVAEFIRAYVINPVETRNAAPEFYKYFEGRVPQDVLQAINQFGYNIRVWAGADAHTQFMANIQWDIPRPDNLLSRVLRSYKPPLYENGFKITWVDKLAEKWTNQLRAQEQMFEYAKGIRGIDEVLPEDDPRILGRLFLGISSKIDNIIEKGMIDARGNRLKGEVRFIDKNGNVTVGETNMNLTWLIEPFDNSTRHTIEQETQEMATWMIAERTVETVTNFERRQIGMDITNGLLPPAAILAKHPDLMVTHSARLEELLEDPEIKEQPFERYDFSMVVLTGVGGGFFKDLDRAKKRFEQIEDLKRNNQDKYERLKEGARRYRAMGDSVLRYMVDKGRMSEESYEQIKRNNIQYVALNRVMNLHPDDQVDVITTDSTGRIGVASEPIKKFTGSARIIQNPLVSLLRAINFSITEADRNELMGTIVDILDAPRGMYEGDVLPLSTAGAKVAVKGPKTIPYYRNGEVEYWEFQDDVYNALVGLNKTGFKIPLMFTLSAKILRVTTVNNPVFALRNRIRDIQNRFVISRTGASLADLFRNNRQYLDDYELFGADQAGYYLRTPYAYHKRLRSAMKELADNKRFILLDPARMKEGVYDKWYERLISSGERATRLEEYRKAYRTAKAKGYDDYNANLYAAYQTRDLLDFAVMGTHMQVINQMIPFSNAAIQGVKRSIVGMQEDPLGFGLRWALYIMLPSVALRLLVHMMGDDEEYQELPDYQRDLFFNVKVGPDLWLTIPKPYELGVMGSGAERLLDHAFYGNDDAFGNGGLMRGYTGSLIRGMLPVDEKVMIGPYVSVVELMANYDFFRGKHIIPPDEAKLHLSQRKYTDSASRFGLFLQDMLGMDARYVDHFIKTQFSYFGRQMLGVSDIGRNSKESLDYSDLGIFKSSPAYSSQSVQYVLRTASLFGLQRNPEYRELQDLIGQYFGSSDREERDRMAEGIREFAKELRLEWEAIDFIKGSKDPRIKTLNEYLERQDAGKLRAKNLAEMTLNDLIADGIYQPDMQLAVGIEILADEKQATVYFKDLVKKTDVKLSYYERQIMLLNVGNGERANYLWNEILKDKSPSEREKIIEEYQKKKIISKNVLKQISALQFE